MAAGVPPGGRPYVRKPVFWPQKTPPHSPRLCDSLRLINRTLPKNNTHWAAGTVTEAPKSPIQRKKADQGERGRSGRKSKEAAPP